jgi:hypothetical protein
VHFPGSAGGCEHGAVFHHSHSFLDPDDVVHAGNWGRVVRGHGGLHPLFLQETLFELVRAREFVDLPSRLTCAFAYDTEAEAAAGRLNDTSSTLQALYEVERVDDCVIHRADLDAWEWGLRPVHHPAEAEEVARTYWRGESPGRQELLVAGDLRVVRVVDRGGPR